jgi:uncharacterized protein (TIGR02594 family)
MTAFERCLAVTLRWEGGWSEHPDDPGGATMKGITIGVYARWKGRRVTKDELRRITDDEVQTIYRRWYWDKVRGDDLPPGLDLVAFDAGVNSGPATGARWLQAALGVLADGSIGPVTLRAAQGATDRAGVITRATSNRMAALQRMRGWATFGKGWTNRVADVRRSALAMAGVPAPTVPTAPATTTSGLPWMAAAMVPYGWHEVRDNARLRAWLQSDGRTLGDPKALPWCGDFAETAIRLGLPNEPWPGALGANPYWARNWALFGVPTEPTFGCVLVFSRGSGGHVGFAVGQDASAFHVLGGNQGDTVSVTRIARSRLLAARWPATFPARPIHLPQRAAGNLALSTNEV